MGLKCEKKMRNATPKEGKLIFNTHSPKSFKTCNVVGISTNLRSGVIFFLASLFLWLEREKNNAWYIHLTSRQPPPNFSSSNVSFEINSREKKIFEYVHVQIWDDAS